MILIKSDLLNDYLKIDLGKNKGIRADILKKNVLRYLRISKESRHCYYLSKFELQGTERAMAEIIIGEDEMVTGAQLSLNGFSAYKQGNYEPLVLKLGTYPMREQR